MVLIAKGFIVYYYWDDIYHLFKRGGDKGKGKAPDDTFISGSESSPSDIGAVYPEGYLKYFTRKIGVIFKRDNNPIPTTLFGEDFIPASQLLLLRSK